MPSSQWPRTSQTKSVVVFSLVLYVFHAQCCLRLPQNQSVVSKEQKVLLVALRTQIPMIELGWAVNELDVILAHLAREKKSQNTCNLKALLAEGSFGCGRSVVAAESYTKGCGEGKEWNDRKGVLRRGAWTIGREAATG